MRATSRNGEAACRSGGPNSSGAAHSLRREKVWSSLEPGKWADFTILDRDILTCPEDAIRETRPTQTFLGGEAVFTA